MSELSDDRRDGEHKHRDNKTKFEGQKCMQNDP